MGLVVVATAVFTLGTAIVAAFQIALALGAPWGEYAMGGGRPGRLPAQLRVAAVVQAAVLVGLAVVVLSRASTVASGAVETHWWLAWVPVTVAAASAVMNALSRSGGERRLWLPVALILLVSSAIVAIGTP
jgi:hypothetical protein